MRYRLLIIFCLNVFTYSIVIGQVDDPFMSPPKDTTPPEEAFGSFVDNEIEFKVNIITCQELDSKIKQHDPIIILDARDQKAYDKSHIPEARRIGNEDFSVERVWTIDRNSSIIIYGESGTKSEEIGELLLQMGFKDVYNLYGSIQEWSNYGGELVNSDGKNTKKIVNSSNSSTTKKRKKRKKKKKNDES